jgi:hypothetical protein
MSRSVWCQQATFLKRYDIFTYNIFPGDSSLVFPIKANMEEKSILPDMMSERLFLANNEGLKSVHTWYIE